MKNKPKPLLNIDDSKRFEPKPNKEVSKDIAKLVDEAYREALKKNKGK